MNELLANTEVLVCLGIVIIPTVLVVGYTAYAIIYSVKEAIRLNKVPLAGFPQTPDEYMAFQVKTGIAQWKRYRHFYIIGIFISLLIPACLCCVLTGIPFIPFQP